MSDLSMSMFAKREDYLAARVAELERENAALEKSRKTLENLLRETEAENAALKDRLNYALASVASVDALRADAERYRWLRLYGTTWQIVYHRESDLDAAIDAARSKT